MYSEMDKSLVSTGKILEPGAFGLRRGASYCADIVFQGPRRHALACRQVLFAYRSLPCRLLAENFIKTSIHHEYDLQ